MSDPSSEPRQFTQVELSPEVLNAAMDPLEAVEHIASLEARLRAAEERERVLRKALERIDAELGMPGRGFPASVASDCWEIARQALATASGEGAPRSRYDDERAGVLSSAVGLARFALSDGRPDDAKRYLDEAAAKTHKLLRDDLIAAGNSPESVDSFLGASGEGEAGEYGLPATHRFYAPGVWLPKETTPPCNETAREWACACARGHSGPHRNMRGEEIAPPTDLAEPPGVVLSDTEQRRALRAVREARGVLLSWNKGEGDDAVGRHLNRLEPLVLQFCYDEEHDELLDDLAPRFRALLDRKEETDG